MSNDSVFDLFLNGVGRYPLLTAEEEIILGHQVRRALELETLQRALSKKEKSIVKRGQRARKRFFEGNLRLVVYIAKRYLRQTQFMDINDLVQEGSLGLMRAIDKYDPERGYKFSTYAYWWIRQGINRSIQTCEQMIRRPSSVSDLASKVPKAVHEYAMANGRFPSTSELALYMQVSESELLCLNERGATPVSLDAIVANTRDAVLLDLIADPNTTDVFALDNQLDADLQLPQLLELLDCLPNVTRCFIERRFGLYGHDPHTYAEIGKQLGVSRERVRQIIDKGLKSIKVKVATSLPVNLTDYHSRRGLHVHHPKHLSPLALRSA